jgi:hypothetical protein
MSDPIPGTGLTYHNQNDSRLHGWLLEALQEGERVNRSDPAYAKADTLMRYVGGEHDVLPALPRGVPPVRINLTGKAYRTKVSALTDLKPTFSFRSSNPDFALQSMAINRYAVIWWINGCIDQQLGNAAKYAMACGSGDLVTEYDPNFLGGDTRCLARDPRDTLPLWAESDDSVHSWEALTLREVHSINKLMAKFPGRHDVIRPDSGQRGTIFTRFRRFILDRFPAGSSMEPSTFDGLGEKNPNRMNRGIYGDAASCTLYRSFLKDRSINASLNPVVVGPGDSWSYVVQPGGKLYPQGRLVLWTEFGILYDGPNPYWSGALGMFPVSRLKLDPWPWSFMGLPLAGDVKELQDIINRTVQLIISNFGQHVERGTIWDRTTSDEEYLTFDPRKPFWKVRSGSLMQAPMKLAEVAALPPWTFQFLEQMFRQYESLTGWANLQQLASLKQMPGRDTLEKYMDALTPELRLEARQIEIFLRDLATQFKSNLFQFQNLPKRLLALGDAGKLISDFDWDPTNMVPAMDSSDPAYIPQLDRSLSRATRASYFMNVFQFYVTPGSLIALQATETKMLYLQLSRQGIVDPWTLAEKLEIENFGEPPNMPLPVLDWKPDPNLPMDGQQAPMEVRKPMTIMERLLAQQQLGLGQTENPAGRKASGQQMPHQEQKGDGRVVMAES